MTTLLTTASMPRLRRPLCALALLLVAAAPTAAQERMYFPAVDNVRQVLVDHINRETVGIDMSAWYLTERAISTALLRRHQAGVPVRLIGDRGSIFEIDPLTKKEFYWLASQGVPIRLRYFPTWYPEIAHWKATIFKGQNIVTFGSSNYTPFELAPSSATNYKDETVLFTDDVAIVNAFKTKFDQMWNDTTFEPRSRISGPPYFLNWDDACARESACSDYRTQYPTPVPMIIDTARTEPDHPMPPDMVWGQGPVFNNRLVAEINAETTFVDFAIYRLTVDNITEALLAKHAAGVPVRIILEPNEYRNKKWPEFWLTHANMDKLWAAGVPIKKRIHQGLTHMKMLVTSRYATNASSNLAAAWQRDHNYFVPAATKPAIYGAMRDRFNIMWNDAAGFADFTPEPPHTPTLAEPVENTGGVPVDASLVWNRAPFAVSYDVWLGTSSSSLVKVGNVPARLVNDPPLTYSWKPAAALQPATTYYWRVVALTNATHVNPSLKATSTTWAFTTAGVAGPPPAPSNPAPPNAGTGVGPTPQLSWAPGGPGVTFNVDFGTSNPPPPVASGLATNTYQPGTLAPSTTFYWRVTAVSSGGSTPGPVWTFTTAEAPAPANEVVIHAADVTTLAGGWTAVADPTAAGGLALQHADAGAGTVSAPLAAPTHYFQTTFTAAAGTRYRVWLRIRAEGDSKLNDSVYVQFSDSVTSGGASTYRIGTPDALTVNLWTCASCQSIGWGWQRHAYWLADTGEVWFQNNGTHTIRVQTREDGARIDQIVISPVTYVDTPPGPVSNDTTIVPKPEAPAPPAAPASPSPANGATGVALSTSLTWSADGATSYDVAFGTANPPPVIVSGHPSASYTPSGLTHDTTYYWRIVARNGGGTTEGPVWSFTTTSPPAVPPGVPASPAPADGAVIGSLSPTLTWSAAGATSYDVRFGATTPPPTAATGLGSASYSPATLAYDTTYYWQVVARNSHGATEGTVWSFTTPPPPPADIVIYASDVSTAALNGLWTATADASSPDGIKLATANTGFASTSAPQASPAHYFDVSFTAQAGTPYTIWLRLRARDNSKLNDAVWVQFSGAHANGGPIYAIGSTSGLLVNLATDASASSLNGWGWQNGAYWLGQPVTVTFPAGGTQTLRVQVREDGVELDQIVLSPGAYLSTPPGPATNDSTVVPKP